MIGRSNTKEKPSRCTYPLNRPDFQPKRTECKWAQGYGPSPQFRACVGRLKYQQAVRWLRRRGDWWSGVRWRRSLVASSLSLPPLLYSPSSSPPPFPCAFQINQHEKKQISPIDRGIRNAPSISLGFPNPIQSAGVGAPRKFRVGIGFVPDRKASSSSREEEWNRMDGEMFGGANWGSSPYTSNAKENQFLFDAKAAPLQLQLFGSTAVPAVGTSGYYNYTGNNDLSVMNQARKTNNDTGDEKQLKLQMSLNNFHLEDADRLACVGNPSAVSTGLRLSYEDDERNSSITSGSGSMSSLPTMVSFVDELMAKMDKENKEIDCHFRIQVEQLGKYMKQVKQRQMISFLASLERGVGKKLREKELEVEAMNRKGKELNEQIRQVAMEVQSWQSAALYNQSVANSLKSKLMQVVAQSTNPTREGSGDSEVENTASSQNINAAPGGFFQSSLLGGKSVAGGLGACRWCRVKEAAVLVMPCRHLCLCADCERNADVCPVCRFPKSGSVEINMS